MNGATNKRAIPLAAAVDAAAAVDDEDDFIFLSEEAAAVEAQALSQSKRFRSAPPPPPQPHDGAYLAVLRADEAPCHLQQKQHWYNGGDQSGFGGDGACFKCGKPGHWARDCDSMGTAAGGGGGYSQSQTSAEPEKPCPCGVGNCIVLTANTEKNKGRRFYKCPVREENGGCGFFQWCDGASGMNNTAPGIVPPAAANDGYKSYGGGGGSSCFKCGKEGHWAKDCSLSPNPSSAAKVYNNNFNSTNNNSYGTVGGSSCFKCGKEGHWAKDCSVSVDGSFNNTNMKSYGGMGGGLSCFKCGKEGHWARDCSVLADVPTAPVRNPSTSSSCYKCGNPGHWARDCSNSKR